MNPQSSENAPKNAPGIPTSVVDFQRSTLHFRYDMTALAAAAASDTDEAKQLRADGARLTRKLARAQADGQRLQIELMREQGATQQLSKELATSRAHGEHAALVVQQARNARVRAEEHLKAAQSANKSLQTELEVARRTLDLERARTVKAVASIGRLRAERDALKAALARGPELQTSEPEPEPLTRTDPGPSPSTSVVKAEPLEEHMEGVEETSTSPVLSPPLSPAHRGPRQPPRAQKARRPHPPPSLTRGEGEVVAAQRPMRPPLADGRRKSTGSPPPPPPPPFLKRKRSLGDGEVVVVDAPDAPPPPPAPSPQDAPPPAPAPQQDAPAPAPAPPDDARRLGIRHLPLLYETRGAGAALHCRACRRAFAAAAAWAELVGHAQAEHADVCAEIGALRPAQVVEQRQRMQYLGRGRGGRR
ncbi:hypothetical protein C8R44DRAFT_917284 [Mycena epipterygia]|nr:hypothetical protein C8R44DRAFT_917284 [Mycena epipterygia]